jgi:hypothetical protein
MFNCPEEGENKSPKLSTKKMNTEKWFVQNSFSCLTFNNLLKRTRLYDARITKLVISTYIRLMVQF